MNLPKEVWIGGKGPSIDTYDWSKAGKIRIGLNEAALIIPDCTDVIAKDYNVWKVLKKNLKSGIYVWVEEGIKLKDYTEWPNNPIFRWKTGVHAKEGYETCPSCISICGYFGVEIIHFVGCDSINYTPQQHQRKGKPYAKSVLKYDSGSRQNFYYEPINRHIWLALKKTGIIPVWEHTKENLVNPWIKEEANEKVSNNPAFVTGRLSQ